MVDLKTIKRKKQVRFDELLKYVWNNDIRNESFLTEESEGHISVDSDGDFCMYGRPHVNKDERFTITEEVEITEDTKIPLIVAMNRDIVNRYAGWSIQNLLDRDKKFGMDYENIYILNDDGSIGELIWSKKKGMVD